jgi:hypothetical protein
MELLMEALKAYYTPFTTQEVKKQAQELIEDYLEKWFNDWHNIMEIMEDLTLESLQNLDSDSMEMIKFQWPLQALSYIAEKKFDFVEDKIGFYTYLFDLYERKWDIIQQNSIFFGKFVLVFTNLALYDKSTDNLDGALTRFKEMMKIEDESRFTQAKFISKYLQYLYEDAYENLEDNLFTFTKEMKLKNNHWNDLILLFRDTIHQFSNEPIDDILNGIWSLYIFKSVQLSSEDRELYFDLSRYRDIDSFILFSSRLLEKNWAGEEDIIEMCKKFNEIINENIHDETFELVWMTLGDIIKTSFELQMGDNLQKDILDFIITQIEKTETNYKALKHLFEAVSQFIRQVPQTEGNFLALICSFSLELNQFSENILTICLVKSK